jgi:hypothetical protein
MSNLLIPAASAGVGFLIGGPVGAEVGWLAGSIYEQSKNVSNTQVGDLRIQTAQYGVPINYVVGQQRVAGNIIWASQKRPYTLKTSSKGQPATTVTCYNQDMAILLCKGPIIGIHKVWANNNLIINGNAVTFGTITGGSGYGPPGEYTVPMTGGSGTGMVCRLLVLSGTVNSCTIIVDGTGYKVGDVVSCSNASIGGTGSGFSIPITVVKTSVAGLGTLYDGTQTTADPTMVAAMGAQNVPSYNGLAYMVLTNFNLGSSGYVPNFSFEIYGPQGF